MDNGGEQVTLPHDFMQADVDHIVLLIVDMLGRVIAHNDDIPLSPESLTRFHSRCPPAITLLDYLRRIVKYAKVERSCLLITLHYIDQICARTPTFTISSLTIHRFLITCIAIASKALCDAFCTNTHYARVGGIKVAELNLLEKEFLTQIEWRLICTREVLQTYYVNLIRTHRDQKFILLDPPGTDIIATSPRALDIVENGDMESEVPSGISNSSASHSTSPSFSTVSTKTIGSLPSKGPLNQTQIRASSTGLIPASASDLVTSPRQPQLPTLEQNMAFETHISSTQNRLEHRLSPRGKRTSMNAFVTSDDESSKEGRPQNRRRILDDGTVFSGL